MVAVKKEKGMGTGKKVAIGTGLVLAAAAATYFLTGERGQKNRAAIKEWAMKAHEEMARELKKVKHVTQEQYHALVEKIVAKYKLTKTDADELIDSLKGHWHEFTK